MKVNIGKRELEMDSKYLTELRSSNDILDDTDALRARLQEDGYLLIRGFHDRDTVMKARTEFLQKLQQNGRLDPDAPLEEGVIGPENKGGMWGGSADQLQEDFPSFLQVVNSPKIMEFTERLLGGPTMTYDFKWPRAIGKGGNTGAHYDVVYMGRGTKSVYTMWTPFGDTSLELGTLALCLGSQHFKKIKETYGEMDVDRDNVATGWFSEDPVEIVDEFGGQWATTSFEAGDMILFGMYMMHASLNNTTNRFRISADTRYQLASEPVDERWVGKKPKGHYAWGTTPQKSVAEARKEWGV
ncbi:phytanoyl-CoA dioxygenase family protein [Bacillaceae bacterium SIJ1]|uniref:phytanoyl-CoA dioxygenase family protein n=1 Tax=Litoribacterium kuwaitense TaxID=1398745 RepID=UPI0013EAD357|nr:phytanoyl-CoA dioxygenase family protein [Litoribacterium kuwaitense]NGP44909.1 phytanoyl-CoA dioxygenase family protein [Litoribacterium kuwaitense]